jgi:dolichyl-diphosphooligosaccharide--protein glycosyltransferase
MDLQLLIFVFPAGVVLCFRDLRDEHVFVIIYAFVASYFAGVMVRLMLTLTPVVCVASAIALSHLLDTYLDSTEPGSEIESEPPSTAASGASTPAIPASTPSKKGKKGSAAALTPNLSEMVATITSPADKPKKSSTRSKGIYNFDSRFAVILNAFGLLSFFVFHCTWVTSTAYSSPSVVLASQNQDGSQHIIDDFREAYYWLRQNTPQDSVVMSWWDYGYQIAGMADRPTLVDNNTWNNSGSSALPPCIVHFAHRNTFTAHIATVGKAMSSPEELAYPILRKHDVEYVLVIFGALIGYSGDDINKFLWMVRIAQGVWPEEIQEPNYFTPQGEYRVDERASTAMRESLMYKMSYYR